MGYKMLPNLAFSLVNCCRVWTCWMMLLCSRLLSSSKICLKEMWRKPGKEKEEDDPENIRPVHGWQKRGGGYMDIMPDLWRSPSSE